MTKKKVSWLIFTLRIKELIVEGRVQQQPCPLIQATVTAIRFHRRQAAKPATQNTQIKLISALTRETN